MRVHLYFVNLVENSTLDHNQKTDLLDISPFPDKTDEISAPNNTLYSSFDRLAYVGKVWVPHCKNRQREEKISLVHFTKLHRRKKIWVD